MKCEYVLRLNYEGKEVKTVYRRETIPFCPPLGTHISIDADEYIVKGWLWRNYEHELCIFLKPTEYESEKAAKEDFDIFLTEEWLDWDDPNS